MGIQFAAGVSLGLLLGMLVGLSASPVVSIVVSALAAALAALLGFAPGSKGSADAQDTSRSQAQRLCGFGLAATLALLTGVYVRTHDLLSPSANEQVQALISAQFNQDEAHTWVSYKNTGLLFRADPSIVVDPKRIAKNSAASFLFDSSGMDLCPLLDPGKFSAGSDQISALKLAGGNAPVFAAMLELLNPADRLEALKAQRSKHGCA